VSWVLHGLWRCVGGGYPFFWALLVLILVVFYYLGAFAGPDALDIRGGERGHVCDKIALLGMGFSGL
jgi:hypothetical protein